MVESFKAMIVLALVLSLPLLGCRGEIDRTEAERIAGLELARYAEREGIPEERFGQPKISTEAGYPWIIEYESDTSPQHLVSVSIDRRGKVELHRMIE